VEATKYTELGYVGHDVEDIIKDLLEAGIALARQRMRAQLAAEARQRTEDRILRALLGQHNGESEVQVGQGLLVIGCSHMQRMYRLQADSELCTFPAEACRMP
jgi:ATP-dependent protease HslVU (ClpYQ) ATPase subunit